MQGPSFFLHSDDDDEIVVPSATSMGRPSFLPRAGPPSPGLDLIVNRKKVSPDVVSLASGMSSQEGTESEDAAPSPRMMAPAPPRPQSIYSDSEEDNEDDVSDAGSEDAGAGAGGGWGAARPAADDYAGRLAAERARAKAEHEEKQEILYQMDRLEAKGYRLPRKFSMQSDLLEMRAEYERIKREREVDASVKFQQKMLMAFVTGVEFLNSRFDPFDIKLNGWSEQVHESLDDYTEILEELHDKYKGTGQKMPPELRLLMSLSGSAFMFHLTNSMFKQTPLPGVEQVLRSNPELMRSFQQAAVQQFTGAGGAAPPPLRPAPAPAAPPSAAGARGPGGGLFQMVGNLFGGPAAPGTAQIPTRGVPTRAPPPEVDDIIDNIHKEISSRPMSSVNRVETMSVSDEEITSLIEDRADARIAAGGAGRGRGGRGGRGAAGRTLDL